jgi:choice-of-anchor B domain-containing protein
MKFRCNEDTVTIVDVTDKNEPELLSRVNYDSASYTHQGWLTDDHNTFLFGDEVDEVNSGFKTRTLVLDVRDLVNPKLVGSHFSQLDVVDHNQYVKGPFTFQANYNGGLRVLKIGDVANTAELVEVASFDVYPEDDSSGFSGAWSNYPYFPSGTVIVSSIDRGLFVLEPFLSTLPTNVLECFNSGERCDNPFDFEPGFQMSSRLAFGGFCLKLCVPPIWVDKVMLERGYNCGWTCS